MTTHWLDTGWGCGGVIIKDGYIKGGAPIFRKLIGRRVDKLPSSYKLTSLSSEEDGSPSTLPPLSPLVPASQILKVSPREVEDGGA